MSSSTLEPFMDEPTRQMMKLCTKCGEAKPATLEYFGKKTAQKSGLDCWCKECKHAIEAVNYANLSPEEKTLRALQGTENKYANPIRTAFAAKRSRAKKAGTEWSLGEARTPEEAIWHKRMERVTHCPDCACEIKWYQQGHMNPDSGSFDRIDSNVGYVEGNVRITCRLCNARKQDSPVDEWVGQLDVRIRKGIISCVDEILLQFLSESKL